MFSAVKVFVGKHLHGFEALYECICMAAELAEKVKRYRKLLSCALEDVRVLPLVDSPLHSVAVDFLNMARSYYEDGVHFMESGDVVNALVCFSYGHGWLDAGVRLGVFEVTRKELFTI
jgi:hypothetical protein